MNNINKEAREIATKLNIDDKINTIAEQPAFITIKDHKLNFTTNPTYRLINPSKSEIGKISKHILDNINKQLMYKLQLNQRKNTKVITYKFTAIPNKNNTFFIQVNITDVYLSITEYTSQRALELADKHVNVLQYDIRIIKHCRKSLLFHDGKPWIKKPNNYLFDVTMGSFDVGEVCEVVDALILSLLSNMINNADMGLYRDDGLIIIWIPNGPKLDTYRKRISNALKLLGFRITIHTNLKIVNFLDVTLKFRKGTYEPYKKDNDTPI